MRKYILSATVLMLAIIASGVTYMRVKTADDQIVKYEVDKVEQIDYERDAATSTWKMRTKTTDGKEEKYNVDEVVEVNYVSLDTIKSNLQGVSVSGEINDYTYVDLGLASGTLWATYNVDADKPIDFGRIISWGEYESKTSYNWESYTMCVDADRENIIKYNKIDSLETLEPEEDAATILWGYTWRIPTFPECQELINGCKWSWTDDFNGTGVAGRLGTSKINGNTIFFPLTVKNAESVGYWTSTINTDERSRSYYMNTGKSKIYITGYDRCWGRNVRAVVRKDSVQATHIVRYLISIDSSLIQKKFVKSGMFDVTPDVPIIPGYLFTGWNDSSFTKVEKDMDVYAMFDKDSRFVVRFFDYDSTLINYQMIEPGEDAIVPESPSKPLSLFLGWSDSSFVKVDHDVNVYALFRDLNYYHVNFYTRDSVLIDSMTVIEGDTAKFVTAPIIDGLVFTGWSDSSFVNIKNDVNAYAQYQNRKIVDGVSVSGKIDDYLYVDLCLPSGTKWATYNVGASKPIEAGILVAWGEYEPKETYTLDNYSLSNNGSNSSFKKYNYNDKLVLLEPVDDAATLNWGSTWRMPTREEQQELINGCYWVWTDDFNGTGIAGRFGTSKNNGNIIFFPAISTNMEDVAYLSSNCYSTNPARVLYMSIGSEKMIVNGRNRYQGGEIRAVARENTTGASYTVRFLLPDSTLIQKKTVGENMFVVTPDAPDLPGYLFDGWCDSSFTNVQKDVDIYARYIIDNRHLIQFFNYDSTLISSQKVFPGKDALVPETPSRPHYFFCGWSDSSFVNVDHDVNIYAQFREPYYYHVNFYTRDSVLIDSMTVMEEETAKSVDAPFIEDYIFVGWSDSSFINIRNDVNTYAQYELYIVDGATMSGLIDGFSYVNLGLESGLMWATYNVGATKPSEYGNCFSWAETQTKNLYKWETYKYSQTSEYTLFKYCMDYNNSMTVDSLNVLEPSDDAVTVNWSGEWRMPQSLEAKELINACDWVWTDNYNGTGVAGCVGKSKFNGNTIFFPAFGYASSSSISARNKSVNYWTSSLSSDRSDYAIFFRMQSGEKMGRYTNARYFGMPVRGVSDSKKKELTWHVVNFYSSDSTLLKSDTIIENHSTSAPKIPEIEGSIFIGWSDSSFVSKVTEDLNIYAKYEQIITVSGKIGDYSYVDLGLESGLKWATYNVGATKYYENGDHFSWGETAINKKYAWANYSLCDGDIDHMNKYNSTDKKTVLDSEDDAAMVNWGNGWRMPTLDEMKELIAGCEWTWVEGIGNTDVSGQLGRSKVNGNLIFLPAAGDGRGDKIYFIGERGFYWTSNVGKTFLYESSSVEVEAKNGVFSYDYYRFNGRCVRAVAK